MAVSEGEAVPKPPLEIPIDLVAACQYLGCSYDYLRKLCRKYGIPHRYRYTGPHKGRKRVLWASEVARLQAHMIRETYNTNERTNGSETPTDPA